MKPPRSQLRSAAVLALAAVWGAAAAAAPADAPRGAWGAFPAEADSVSAALADRGRPAWETALLVPYRIASAPVYLVTTGLTGTAVLLNESRAVREITRFFGGFGGPAGTRISPNFVAGGLLGYGGGLSVTYPFAGYGQSGLGRHRGNKFKLRWQSTSNESHKFTVGWCIRAGERDELQLGVGYRVRPNARYFGLGPATRERDESFFLQELSWAGLSWDRGLGSGLVLESYGLISAIGHRGPAVDEDPPLEERFAAALPPGYGARSDGLTFGLALTHDDTPQTGRPESGGVRRLQGSYFTGLDDADVSFWKWRAEVQQFVPLWLGRRHLALRGFIGRIEARGDDPVPFQRLLTNDEPDLMRGYEDYRWRDEGMAVLTAEYRWPIWNMNDPHGTGLDAYLFTDLGQVFGEFEELSFAHLTESYGGGLRVIDWGGGFTARLEVAWSDEDTVLRLRGDQLFQFTKGGLYHGRDPVPFR